MSLEINGTTVIINGETIAVSKRPKFKKGAPKVESRTSFVGNETKVTQSRDFSEAVGMVTIALRNTVSNHTLIDGWLENVGKNAIRITDAETSYAVTFNQMSIEEEPERDLDSEEIEIVFKGGQGQ